MSVPGGSHWGDGVSISALDQARIGLMLMAGGKVDGQQVLSSGWIARMQQPCSVAPYYGYRVWLNQGGHLFEAAPRSSWFAIGAGSSLSWIDARHELVCVLRWIDPARTNDCIERIMAAIIDRQAGQRAAGGGRTIMLSPILREMPSMPTAGGQHRGATVPVAGVST